MSDGTVPYAYVRLPRAAALNARLRAALLEMSAAVPGRGTNAPHGTVIFSNKWLSPPDLHQAGPGVFRELAGRIEDFAARVAERKAGAAPLRVTAMWAIVSEAGMEGLRHNHGGLLSTIYYVDVGDSGAAGGGLLQFYAEAERPDPSHEVTPEPGLLIAFPSALHHAVTRYDGTAPRIVISASLE